jgi:tetratricopeptide (TPR) repeat protein
MILATLLLLQAATAAPAPGTDAAAEARFEKCADLATGSNPVAGRDEASQWQLNGGTFLARQCLGLAYATEGNYAAAADAFEGAARGAEVAKDKRRANYWAQAGNAWLAAGNSVRARTALDAALATGTLKDQALGEAHLDRARAKVAAGDTAGARADIDMALLHAGSDPLAWLLSATLARRTGDLPRAQKDIAAAIERASDDASVQLEAGNISASASDESGARQAWTRAATIGGDTPVGAAAKAALAQFAAGK